ncbi:protein THYLAKOID ASSEMBLY 8-like, chloroplastic [Heracleum sosnowskyi]|uniref:Protein THYLAKOID ASSEMBLY 8-like, chloroplastic n=1 Tax=Heracleum sosnowskyi TaxID=360622 RepID=A0AAD8MNK2_9APIA|nr:protein THYLAKOID ASSEMBLY 8-like, chloroplastic [Heracleum sosnowskyi]
MGSLVFQISQLGFIPNRKTHLNICCGLRNGNRKPMWRSRILSTEAIQAVHSLKLAKSPAKLQQVFDGTISRLLKADLLDTLGELNRQNQVDLALKVFEFLRKEVWYKPDVSLFCDMILMLGKKKLISEVEELFSELKKEGLVADTRAYTELIGAYIQVDMLEKAMETYEFMKASGCVPDKNSSKKLKGHFQNEGHSTLFDEPCNISPQFNPRSR